MVEEPLINLASCEVKLVDRYKMVKDYWDEQEGWLWDLLEGKLPGSVLDRLATILMVDDGQNADGIFWEASNSGNFTVKSAYKLSIDVSWVLSTQFGRRFGSCLFQVGCVPFSHGRIMTKVKRTRKGFTTNTTCKFWVRQEEDIYPLMRSCTHVSSIWAYFLPK